MGDYRQFKSLSTKGVPVPDTDNHKNPFGIQFFMSFDQQKRDNLKRLDKSIKKSIDERIRGIVEFLNSLPAYFTTSSCSGRVMLLERKKSWKKDSRFVYREHEKEIGRASCRERV